MAHSTSPEKGTGLKEFTLFPRLPAELRNLVWQHVSPDILPIRIYPSRAKVTLKIPGCFHTCKEARQEIVRHTPFLLDSHQVGNFSAELMIKGTRGLRDLCKSVRIVLIYRCMLYHDHPFIVALRNPSLFPQLQKVGVVVKCDRPLNDQPAAFLLDSNTIRSLLPRLRHQPSTAQLTTGIQTLSSYIDNMLFPPIQSLVGPIDREGRLLPLGEVLGFGSSDDGDIGVNTSTGSGARRVKIPEFMPVILVARNVRNLRRETWFDYPEGYHCPWKYRRSVSSIALWDRNAIRIKSYFALLWTGRDH